MLNLNCLSRLISWRGKLNKLTRAAYETWSKGEPSNISKWIFSTRIFGELITLNLELRWRIFICLTRLIWFLLWIIWLFLIMCLHGIGRVLMLLSIVWMFEILCSKTFGVFGVMIYEPQSHFCLGSMYNFGHGTIIRVSLW